MKCKLLAMMLCIALLCSLWGCTWVENIGTSTETTIVTSAPPSTEPEPLEVALEEPTSTSDTQKIYSAFAGAASVPALANPYASEENVTVHFENSAGTALLSNGLFYVLNKYQVMIFRADGADSKELSTISFSIKATESYQEYTNDFFVFGDQLAVITSLSSFSGSDTPFSRVAVKFYNVSDPSEPVLLTEYAQDGEFLGAYADGSTLYLISSAVPQIESGSVDLPSVYDGASASPLPDALVCGQPNQVRYTVAASYDLAAACRIGSAAMTDHYALSAVKDHSLYLARSAVLTAQSAPYEKDQYSVTDCLSAAYTEILKFDSSMELQASTYVPGSPIAMSVSDAVYVVSTENTRGYSLFTDETYGWSNRLEGENSCAQRLTALDESLSLRYEAQLPDKDIAAIRFTEDMCIMTLKSTAVPLCVASLSDGVATQVSVLPSAQNRIFLDGNSAYLLSDIDTELYASTLSADGSIHGSTHVGTVPYGAVMFCPGGSIFSVSYDGHTRLLNSELTLLATVAVTGASHFAMDDSFLYVYTESFFDVISLESYQIVKNRRIGV